MYFLLSPAKSLNEKDALPVNLGNYYSQPELIEHAQGLMKDLKAKEPIGLQELMSISDDLAQLNARRNQDWAWSANTPFTGDNAKPAGYLFDGDVYTGLICIIWTKILLFTLMNIWVFCQVFMAC